MTHTPQSVSAVPPPAVLVASGDAAFRKQVLDALLAARQPGLEALGGADALLKLEATPCAGLVLDRQLPDLDAGELRDMVTAQYPQMPVEVVDSAALPAADVFACLGKLQAGALPEPSAAPARLAAIPAAPRSLPLEPRPAAAVELLPHLIGRSPHLRDVSALVRMVAPRRTPVLLLGETGTGKEMIAEAVHAASPRAQRPFVVVNCAAIPEALLESELFGFVRGAFTGAVQSRAGRILSAHTGTLFLDEIGDLPLALQAKLLRFLQQGELQRLGSNDPQHVDVRVLAATNADLAARVAAGEFRRDLYYRLAVFPIELQPLRERPDDIVPLARHFLRQWQAETGETGPCFAAETLDLLEQYPWPGNVRELQHALERASILASGQDELLPRHFPAAQAWHTAPRPRTGEVRAADQREAWAAAPSEGGARRIGPRRAEEWTEATGTHAFV